MKRSSMILIAVAVVFAICVVAIFIFGSDSGTKPPAATTPVGTPSDSTSLSITPPGTEEPGILPPDTTPVTMPPTTTIVDITTKGPHPYQDPYQESADISVLTDFVFQHTTHNEIGNPLTRDFYDEYMQFQGSLQYEYDDNGKLIDLTMKPLKEEDSFVLTYDENGAVAYATLFEKGESNPTLTLLFTYDDEGRIAYETRRYEKTGKEVGMMYDRDGRLIKSTIQTLYDGGEPVDSVEYVPNGAETSFRRNDSIKAEEGTVTFNGSIYPESLYWLSEGNELKQTYKYNYMDLCIAVDIESNNILRREFQHDAEQKLIKQTVSYYTYLSQVTQVIEIEYDAAENAIKEEETYYNYESEIYETALLEKQYDAEGKWISGTKYRYGDTGTLIEMIVFQNEYDANGLCIKETKNCYDGIGHFVERFVTEYEYDSYQNLIEMAVYYYVSDETLNAMDIYRYASSGAVIEMRSIAYYQITQNKIYESVWTFDIYGNQISMQEHVREYDQNGNLIKETVSYWDENNRLWQTETLENKYNTEGALTDRIFCRYNVATVLVYKTETEFDEDQNRKKEFVFYYNDDGKPTCTEEYDGNQGLLLKTEFIYDADGNFIRKALSENEYNANNKLIRQTYSQYHADGSLLTKTVSEFEYTAQGKLYKQVAFYYDADGVLFGKVEYEYDANGNMIKITQTYYNADGEVTH